MGALPAQPAVSATDLPVWLLKGWAEPGAWGEGRVDSYVPRKSAGWIRMDDEGPDVYFRPEHLDATLKDILRDGQIRHTRVSTKVYYRDNGRDRHTREVLFLAESTEVQG